MNIVYTSTVPHEEINYVHLGTNVLWILITGAYVAIATWALLSKDGRSFLNEEKEADQKSKFLWYLKLIFACYAAALATFIFVGVALLPVVGFSVLDAAVESGAGLLLLLVGLLWAPFISKHLK
jgi:hypothetical protein